MGIFHVEQLDNDGEFISFIRCMKCVVCHLNDQASCFDNTKGSLEDTWNTNV